MVYFEVTRHPVKHFGHCQRTAVIQKKGQSVAFCPVGGGQTDRQRKREMANPFGHERKKRVQPRSRTEEVNCKEEDGGRDWTGHDVSQVHVGGWCAVRIEAMVARWLQPDY